MPPVWRFAFVFIALFQLPVFAQNSRVVVVNTASKELKRTAHHLHIPVEQLRNARKALQEATDLVPAIDPYPTDQLMSLAMNWRTLNRPKSNSVIKSFIQDLKSQAAQSSDFSSYQRMASAAVAITEWDDELDYERKMEMIRSWPDPPSSLGDAAADFRKNMESQAKSQFLGRLLGSDPEKAYDILSQPGEIDPRNYTVSGLIAQNLMSIGKNDDALRLIDQTMADFRQRSGDPGAVQSYENFVRTAITVDSERGSDALSQWAAQLMKQPQPSNCRSQLKTADTSVELTCTESRILNTMRSFSSRPVAATDALDSMPDLKSKLDEIGGIGALVGSQATIVYGTPAADGKGNSGAMPAVSMNNPSKLMKELKGKAEKDPVLVKQKLHSLANGPEDIDMLISLAMIASYQDPDLADLALETARPLLARVESLQRRSSSLQNMIRAYRQADGEVDEELLKTGFIIADQLRQEQSEKHSQYENNLILPVGIVTPADRFEAFLVAELSRDSFESAIRYVRSMDIGTLKLTCLIEIVQALSQSNL